MAPKTYKSFHYKAKTNWSSARRGMLLAAGRPNIVVGSPPEFRGEPGIWAPEELLVGSLNTCIMLTFLTLAQAQGLIPTGYESEAEGLLENVEGKYHITEVTVRPRVTLLMHWPSSTNRSNSYFGVIDRIPMRLFTLHLSACCIRWAFLVEPQRRWEVARYLR